MVAVNGETSAHNALQKMYERMRRDITGAQILG